MHLFFPYQNIYHIEIFFILIYESFHQFVCNVDYFSFFFEQTSQLDAFTNADQLSQIGIPYGVTSKKAQIQDAEANVRLFPKLKKSKEAFEAWVVMFACTTLLFS